MQNAKISEFAIQSEIMKENKQNDKTEEVKGGCPPASVHACGAEIQTLVLCAF